MVFSCKELENITCDGILNINMFQNFKIPYIIYTLFTKFTYNEYIGLYFLSHIISKKIASPPPPRVRSWVRNKD